MKVRIMILLFSILDFISRLTVTVIYFSLVILLAEGLYLSMGMDNEILHWIILISSIIPSFYVFVRRANITTPYKDN